MCCWEALGCYQNTGTEECRKHVMALEVWKIGWIEKAVAVMFMNPGMMVVQFHMESVVPPASLLHDNTGAGVHPVY